MDKTNVNALVQTIERFLHLTYKQRFSIEQYLFCLTSALSVGCNMYSIIFGMSSREVT